MVADEAPTAKQQVSHELAAASTSCLVIWQGWGVPGIMSTHHGNIPRFGAEPGEILVRIASPELLPTGGTKVCLSIFNCCSAMPEEQLAPVLAMVRPAAMASHAVTLHTSLPVESLWADCSLFHIGEGPCQSEPPSGPFYLGCTSQQGLTDLSAPKLSKPLPSANLQILLTCTALVNLLADI